MVALLLLIIVCESVFLIESFNTASCCLETLSASIEWMAV